MKLELFNRIVHDYYQLEATHGKNQSKLIIDSLVDRYKLSYLVIYSICAFEHRNGMKQTTAKPPFRLNWPTILSKWDSGNSLQEVADMYKLDASVVLRQLVLRLTNHNREEMKSLFRDSTNCADGRLAFEIELSHQRDLMNGIFNTQVNHVNGLHFEAVIRSKLAQQSISYRSEEELRQNRYDVTPDFLLSVPLILIRTRDGLWLSKVQNEPEEKLNGELGRYVINWMECKAMFASIQCHAEYYESQFFAYRNRFGSGLVFYSLGFVDEIPKELLGGITLAQQMPPFCPLKLPAS